MALKPTVRRKQIAVPVEWQDSEWDLEVRIGGMQNAECRMQNEEFGVRNGCLRIWRCGLGQSQFPLTLGPSMNPSPRPSPHRMGRGRKPNSNCGNGLSAGMSALRGGVMKNKFMAGRHHRRAFTLIELLVVISIIAIL